VRLSHPKIDKLRPYGEVRHWSWRILALAPRFRGALLAAGFGSLACARREALPAAPAAIFGQSVAAQQSFRPLEQAWLEGTPRERLDLEPRLQSFIQSYPKDPEIRQAQVWLAWLRVSKGRFDEALALAEQASADKIGTTAEAAAVIRAAVFTRRGQPEQSLRILEPLSGQIVDSRERDTWAREIILATLRLEHYDDVLKWALVWRLESSEDRRASIEREIGVTLDKVSRPALERLWLQLEVAERIASTIPGRKQARVWMREAVLQRLTRFAIDKQDPALARRLLNDAWLPLQKNSSLKRLARVAAKGEGERQNLSRTIGVILDLDDARERRRSSELITGVIQTLDDASGQGSLHLLTREASRTEREGYAEAVEDLYNEGVALLIGGFDSASATELARNARARMMPVVTLSRFEMAERSEFSFWIDTSEDASIEAWRKLTGGSSNADRIVTDADPFCNDGAETPFDRWRSERVERVLFACGEACAEKFGQAALESPRMPAIWLGPKAAGAWDAWRAEQITGELTFPRLAVESKGDSALDHWQKMFLRLPTYYEVLGHDVTVLARNALKDIPNRVASDAENRSQVLRAVVTNLIQARAPLWSSQNNGFSAEHSLELNFVARRVNSKTHTRKNWGQSERRTQ